MRHVLPTLLSFALAPLALAQDPAPYTAGLVIAPGTTRIESLHDIDGDGIKDAIGWFWVDSDINRVRASAHLFDGQGRVRRTVQVESPHFGNHINLHASSGSTVGDFDGDGLLEQVVFVHDLFVRMEFDAQGDIAFLSNTPHPNPVWNGTSWSYRHLRVLDFNGDGKDDFVMVGTQGMELWTAANGPLERVDEVLWSDYFHTTIDLGEFDGQPGTDVAVSFIDWPRDAVRVFSVAGGVIQEHLHVDLHGGGGFIDLSAGDIDGDGDDDLLIFGTTVDLSFDNNWYQSLHTLHQTAPGVFTQAPRAIDTGPATALADIDGDGDLDGICCGGSGGTVPYVNNEASTFEVSINEGGGVFRLAEPFPGLGAEHIAGPVDFDGDGDVDLVAGRVVLLNTMTAGALECLGTENSTGLPAILRVLGSASMSRNDMVLHTRNIPPGQFGLSVFGTELASMPLFDGQLCVGGQIVRLPIQQTDGFGRMELALDFSGPLTSGLAPGDIIRVQTWYRDPVGNTGANLSNSGRVLLMP